MNTLGSKLFAGLVAGFFAATTLGLAATGSHKKPERGTDVTFDTTMKLNSGDTLKAGTYRMEVAESSPAPEVSFYKDGKVIAKAQAKAVTEEKKNSQTEIDYTTQGDAQMLTEIRPAGWEEALFFGSSAQSGATNSGGQ